jgi:hypothetical protein
VCFVPEHAPEIILSRKKKKKSKKKVKKKKKKKKEAKDAHKRGPSCPQKEVQVAHFLSLLALCWPGIWHLWYCFKPMPISAHSWHYIFWPLWYCLNPGPTFVVLFQTQAHFSPLLAFIFGHWPIICNLAFVVLHMPILAHSWLSCKAHSWPILAKSCRCSRAADVSNFGAINHLLQS